MASVLTTGQTAQNQYTIRQPCHFLHGCVCREETYTPNTCDFDDLNLISCPPAGIKSLIYDYCGATNEVIIKRLTNSPQNGLSKEPPSYILSFNGTLESELFGTGRCVTFLSVNFSYVCND
jgi:hypothetical protein